MKITSIEMRERKYHDGTPTSTAYIQVNVGCYIKWVAGTNTAHIFDTEDNVITDITLPDHPTLGQVVDRVQSLKAFFIAADDVEAVTETALI